MSDHRTEQIDEIAAELIAEALHADGYNPAPYVGQRWTCNASTTWLPEGHARIVTIDRIWKLIHGWSVAVTSTTVDQHNRAYETGQGAILVDHLLADYTPTERVPA